MDRTVYVPMAADILHKGHINILREASKYGRVIVGLLNDAAIESYKRKPIITYESRYEVIQSIRMVDRVVEQTTHDYTINIKSISKRFPYKSFLSFR